MLDLRESLHDAKASDSLFLYSFGAPGTQAIAVS